MANTSPYSTAMTQKCRQPNKPTMLREPFVKPHTPLLTGIVMILVSWSPASAELIRITSPATQATLVELYTSEGCSSCPPADRWLSKLKENPRLWHDLVPVAFHVDYWNYLGWNDRFSAASFSQRQRDYAGHGLLRTVYTPGFVVNGREWRGGFTRPKLASGSDPKAGPLEPARDGNALQVDYRPHRATTEPMTLHIARLGFDLTTEVRRGENNGKLLNHDFVVLGHKQASLKLNGNRFGLVAQLPDASVDAPRQAVALWVTRSNDPRPLQAAGGWIE